MASTKSKPRLDSGDKIAPPEAKGKKGMSPNFPREDVDHEFCDATDVETSVSTHDLDTGMKSRVEGGRVVMQRCSETKVIGIVPHAGFGKWYDTIFTLRRYAPIC